jgi:hypothetical protein
MAMKSSYTTRRDMIPETRLALFDFAFENASIGIALADLEC